MSEQNEGQEPTMEEILASIRRIISEEGEPEKSDEGASEPDVAAEPEVEPEPEAEAEPEFEAELEEEEEVLELTEALPEEPEEVEEPEVEPEPEPEPEPETDMEAVAFDEEPEEEPVEDEPVEEIAEEDIVEFEEPEEEPEPEMAAAPTVNKGKLLSEEAETAASAAFGALASTILTSSGSGRTLEDLVAEMLKPMLKSWLDQNLPPLVEKLVKEEIERVSRRGR